MSELTLTEPEVLTDHTDVICSSGLGHEAELRCGCWLIEKRETAIKAITRNLDRCIWRDLMNKSDMLSLMDAKGRDQSYSCLEKDDIPAVSEKNILNTFEQLHLNKGEVFERCVINMFKGLSWWINLMTSLTGIIQEHWQQGKTDLGH